VVKEKGTMNSGDQVGPHDAAPGVESGGARNTNRESPKHLDGVLLVTQKRSEGCGHVEGERGEKKHEREDSMIVRQLRTHNTD
jgi:hypothetical protein